MTLYMLIVENDNFVEVIYPVFIFRRFIILHFTISLTFCWKYCNTLHVFNHFLCCKKIWTIPSTFVEQWCGKWGQFIAHELFCVQGASGRLQFHSSCIDDFRIKHLRVSYSDVFFSSPTWRYLLWTFWCEIQQASCFQITPFVSCLLVLHCRHWLLDESQFPR